MEYGIIVVMIICGVLLFIEIDELKKQVKSQQKQIDTLWKQTGNKQLLWNFNFWEAKKAQTSPINLFDV